MINKEQKDAWVAALRSGKYKQGRARLKTNNNSDGVPSFCCLGVLRELFPAIQSYAGNNYTLACGTIPNDLQLTLVHMNDQARKSFNEIADFLEAHPFGD